MKRRKARHPEFRGTGDQRSDALQRLRLDHFKRKQREARAQMVYEWARGKGGVCTECKEAVAVLFEGRPPLTAIDLPHCRSICQRCAAQIEGLARDRRDAHGAR